jgi:hypothetical protein
VTARANGIPPFISSSQVRGFGTDGRQTLPWDYFTLARDPTGIRTQPLRVVSAMPLLTSTILFRCPRIPLVRNVQF